MRFINISQSIKHRRRMILNSRFNLKSVFIAIVGFIFAFSCKKFVTVNPPNTELVSATIFTSDATATATITGIYGEMINSVDFAGSYFGNTSFLLGLSSDELQNYSTNPDQIEFYTNTLNKNNGIIQNSFWAALYQYIYDANSAIEGLTNNSVLTASVEQQLLGEAKFIRAFCYFYLVNLFGDVPLALSTNYQVNSVLPRTPASQVYQQIIEDLQAAQNLLNTNYITGNEGTITSQRVRPNRWTATALLARVYLYIQDWADSKMLADSVISNISLYSLDTLNGVFLANSNEAIWQLQGSGVGGLNTWDGQGFILTTAPNNVAMSSELYNSFEASDNRKAKWIDSIIVNNSIYYFPYKYKIAYSTTVTENTMVLRLAEQYLIRAEAKNNQNDIVGAQADINVIRNRAGLANTLANDQESIAMAIEHERQVELFTEWGHRWLDIKRTNRADAVLEPIKTPNWQSKDTLYPIPQSELNNDINLIQNPGY